jgi:hypothetical protein
MIPPVYAGMDLTHFQCRNCSWAAATAVANLAYMRNLTWLDISYNPVTVATLPLDWQVLPLAALKVRCTACAKGDAAHSLGPSRAQSCDGLLVHTCVNGGS